MGSLSYATPVVTDLCRSTDATLQFAIRCWTDPSLLFPHTIPPKKKQNLAVLLAILIAILLVTLLDTRLNVRLEIRSML